MRRIQEIGVERYNLPDAVIVFMRLTSQAMVRQSEVSSTGDTRAGHQETDEMQSEAGPVLAVALRTWKTSTQLEYEEPPLFLDSS